MDKLYSLLIWGLLAAGSAARADVVELTPAADTTLFEAAPNANLGAHTDLAVGGTSHGQLARGLVRFNLDGSVPSHATVQSVTFEFRVVRTPLSGGEGSSLQLHRVLVPWTEGTKSGTLVTLATDGEPTWLARAHPFQAWAAAGAGSGADFTASPSASLPMDSLGSYTVGSTAALVADVQRWIDQPSENFGWLLRSDGESSPETARRIATRENSTFSPILTVEFSLASPTLEITNFAKTDDSLLLSWTGGQPPFQIQAASALNPAPDWADAGGLLQTNSTLVPLAAPQRFFRVISDSAARYQLTFSSPWSSQTHPQSFPPSPHWSGLAGAVHNNQIRFWELGSLATDGIKDVAELGSRVRIYQEVDAAINSGSARSRLSGGGINPSPGSVSLEFEATRSYPLVTLVSMIAPSPDWFVGVAGLSLLENGRWLDEKTVDLDLYDAGTDSGSSYTSPDSATAPREPISKITGFPAEQNGSPTTFGTFTFRRLP